MILNKLTIICGEYIDDIGLKLYHLLQNYQPNLKEDLSFNPQKKEVNLLVNLNQYNSLPFLKDILYIPVNYPFSSIEGVYKGVEFFITKLNEDYLSLSFSNPKLKEEDLYFFFKNLIEQALNLMFNYQDNVVYIDSNTLLRKEKFSSHYLQKSPLLKEYNFSFDNITVLNNLTYYLNEIAQPNDLLILQFPERDLHPRLLRLLIRFIVRLVQVKIRVMVITHNDYIIKELNTLIMGKIGGNEDILYPKGYKENELISMNDVTAYELKDSLLPVEVNENGIEILTLDAIINDMNETCELLYWE